MKNRQDEYEKTVKAYYTEKMSERERACAWFANLDLYFGPNSRPDEGDINADLTFSKAVDELCAWWRDQPREVWLDMDCDHVSESEPEGWTDEETGEFIEPAWECWMHFDTRAVKRALFGSELAGFIR
jgi:hypothetical protein